MISNMKGVKYLAPAWQKVSVKNTTDGSGNRIVEQDLSYSTIHNFAKAGIIDNNVFSQLTSKQRLQVPNFPHSAQSNGNNRNLINEYKQTFNEAYQKQLTKNLLDSHASPTGIDLTTPVSQQIYRQRLIGYSTDGNLYVLTKAQTKIQKAVLGNPK